MDPYDEKIKPFEERLKPQLTDEWLATLVEAARTCGWMVDHTETESFIRWCFSLADKEYKGSTEPYVN
jgi:hypothetical protein